MAGAYAPTCQNEFPSLALVLCFATILCTLLPPNKNKDSLKEKSRKTHSTHRAEKKLHSGDQKDKREEDAQQVL